MHRLLLVVLAFALAAATPHAQARPDLSGKWEVIDPAGMSALGRSFTVTQTPSTLTVESGTSTNTYAFNGVETKETPPPPQRTVNDDPKTTLWMHRESSTSRAAWMGERLVIVTHHHNRVNVPQKTPSESESQITVRYLLVLDGPDRLVVERITIVDPDFDAPMWIDVPVSVKSAYKKASH